MSKVSIAGDVNGTGVITLAAPVTNTNRTITLPDVTATVITDSAGVLNIGAGQIYKDANGNLGLGVVPSAWGSAVKALQIGNSSLAGSSTQMLLSQNYVFNGSTDAYIANGPAAQYYQVGGTHQWRTAPSGTAGAAISFTQAMTLDSSGNVGIGTSSPVTVARASFGNSAATTPAMWAAYFGTNSALAAAPPNFGISLGWNYSGGNGENNLVYGTGIGGASGLVFASSSGTVVTERARIDSSGNLLVAQTSVNGTNGKVNVTFAGGSEYGIKIKSSVSGSGAMAQFNNSANGEVGTITTTNTTTAYNTSSDYRLKNTIAPMTGALNKVVLLKPCTYKWNTDGSDGQGFIAHELQAVEPGCVSGEKDAVDAEGKPKYQGIDTSFLVATLAAAIQELKAIVDAQGAEIASLKGASA
jgi:hypothetical protein